MKKLLGFGFGLAALAAVLSVPGVAQVGQQVVTTLTSSQYLTVEGGTLPAVISSANLKVFVNSGGTAGSVIANDITGGDASLDIVGKAAAAGAAGGAVPIAGAAGGAGSTTTAGGTGGGASVSGGAGGAKTDTGHAAGGVGGNSNVLAGAGGATASNGTDAGGAGGTVAVTGGAGGNASAGTGNGGAGGSITLTAGTGGTSAGGTAGANGVIIERSVKLVHQGTPTAATTSATLTAAQVLAGIITVNQGGAAASAQQLPAATAMDTALPDSAAGDAFDFSVINISTTAAESASLTTNTGLTLVGDMDILANSAATTKSAGRFRALKTGTGAWTVYRLS